MSPNVPQKAGLEFSCGDLSALFCERYIQLVWTFHRRALFRFKTRFQLILMKQISFKGCCVTVKRSASTYVTEEHTHTHTHTDGCHCTLILLCDQWMLEIFRGGDGSRIQVRMVFSVLFTTWSTVLQNKRCLCFKSPSCWYLPFSRFREKSNEYLVGPVMQDGCTFAFEATRGRLQKKETMKKAAPLFGTLKTPKSY